MLLPLNNHLVNSHWAGLCSMRLSYQMKTNSNLSVDCAAEPT
jgi:hypothetical protein